MPWMIAFHPTIDTAAELVSLGFQPVTMYMKQVSSYHSEGHINHAELNLKLMKLVPKQYASFSFVEQGKLGPVYAVAVTCDAGTSVLLHSNGFKKKEVYLKEGPKGSILDALPEGDRLFQSMQHVPSHYACVCYWERASG